MSLQSSSPFLFALLCGGVLLILSLFIPRKLFRDRWLFLFFILLFASGRLLEKLKL